MREIIFRGQDSRSKKWIYGYYNGRENSFARIIDTYNITRLVNPETVGQYTGLCDKNGVKVFEEDIVRIFDGEYFSGVVKYSNEQGSFTVDDTSLHYWVSDIEVIGNIHDNFELLNE